MNTSGARDPLDRWYTPEAAARVMMLHVLRPGWLRPEWTRPGSVRRVLDPACGGGVFVRATRFAEETYKTRPRLTIEVWSWDTDPDVVAPDCGNVHQSTSFLDATRDEIEGAIVATNPPFTLAEDFVRHAIANGAASVSLLLPLSFRGSEARIPLWRNLAEVALMHPRITYGGPAREAKIRETEAKGRKYADSANGDSAVFTWRAGHVGPATLIDLPTWRQP